MVGLDAGVYAHAGEAGAQARLQGTPDAAVERAAAAPGRADTRSDVLLVARGRGGRGVQPLRARHRLDRVLVLVLVRALDDGAGRGGRDRALDGGDGCLPA